MFWLTEVSTAHKVMHAYTYAQRSLFSLASFMRVQANMRSRWVLIFMHVCLSASVVCFKLYDTNRHRHWFCCLFVFSLMGCAKWRRCQLVIVQDWLSKVRVPALHITKLSKEQHWKRTSMKVFSCICFCVPLWSFSPYMSTIRWKSEKKHAICNKYDKCNICFQSDSQKKDWL